MKLIVSLHSGLIREDPERLERRMEVELDGKGTVLDLIDRLDLSVDPDLLLLAVNGDVAELTTKLSEGDQVHLMLPISGGSL